MKKNKLMKYETMLLKGQEMARILRAGLNPTGIDTPLAASIGLTANGWDES
ncbi:MAG TPA: hypothetical protein VMO17_07065 [Terriglobia bacterium]|nr:hypothetical protein [Terriglobia bacterium]